MPKRNVPESEIEGYLVDCCCGNGWLCFKLVEKSKRGWPDRTVLCPGGHTFFVETKTRTGKLSRHQIDCRNKLRRYGYNVYVPRTAEDVDYLMETQENFVRGLNK